MNCKVKQGCLTSESCCILLWLAFTLFPVSVVTAADNRKIDESQQKEVKAEMKGYVGDENGEPVIGATVLESGTQNGVITDVDGIFTIQLAKNASLTISYVGYQKKTVVVKDKKFISVNLTPDRSMMLDEVVVVGFGKQKKESLVGAVQAVKPEDLKMTSSNLSTSFAGNVPGIIAVQTQGEPGSDEAKFYIRGISTFGSNTSPLIILDGVEINATMMNNIPPESIASFSVLKDATATSLYGSRGANGVIIVTTKQGQLSEKMSVDIRFDNTFSMPTYVQKMADGPTYMDIPGYYKPGETGHGAIASRAVVFDLYNQKMKKIEGLDLSNGYGVLVSKYKDGLAIANASTTTKGIYYLNPQTDKINPIPMITTIGNPMAIEWFGN